jgi:hypothetical protein
MASRSLRADCARPTGFDVGDRPLNRVACAGYAGFFDGGRDAQGFTTSATEIGGGIELPMATERPMLIRFRRARPQCGRDDAMSARSTSTSCAERGDHIQGGTMRRLSRNIAFAAIVAAAGIAAATALHADAAPAQPRTEQVPFAKGSTSATIKGRLQGDRTIDYRVRAGAGQTLTVTLKASNPQNYFNVLPPGSVDVAMFVGQDGGGYKGMLPTDGDYTVRVYLMRPAARRNETSNYMLAIGVTGKALPPLAASTDALIPGTKSHASAQVPCKPPFDPKPQQCEAFVIRRGVDGTATVEVRSPAATRRILFVAGAPVAGDATEPLTHSRDGDRSVVNFGTDERYEIPDALVRGG